METKKHGFHYHLLDVVFNVVVIVAVVAAVRTFLVSPFQVEGNSMLETLYDKEYIIINKFSYITGDPQRGDVVVFRPPNDESKYYVKRVIGIPGDEIRIRDGFVYLKTPGEKDYHKLDESEYLSDQTLGRTYRHPPGSADATVVSYEVPEGTYFLLGDNRTGSLDSRSFFSASGQATPYVDNESIKGKVWFIALPITKIHALEAPDFGGSVPLEAPQP